MRLTCPQCRTPYDVARSAIGRGGREVKCEGCGHVWRVSAGGGGAGHKAAVKVAAFAAAVSLVAGGLLHARAEISRLLPGAAGVYAAFGYPVHLQGLEFRNVAVETGIEDGVPVLSVSGDVVNVTDGPVVVPPIRYAMRDGAEVEVYHWIGKADAPMLAPAGATAFATRLASPPIAGEHVVIRFVTGDLRIGTGGF